MALLDHLIEVFNSNNFFVPVSVCVVVGAVLLFTVIKWLSKSDKRHKAASVDVDDWDKEIQNGLKKTKQKKVKASANAQADSGSISSRLKVTGKQSVTTKVTTPPAKEKQADEKPKSLAKKPTAVSPVSSKSLRPTSEVQGEWTVAGSKKKQKNKKTVADVKESKTKDRADRQTKGVDEMGTRTSVADIAPKGVESSHVVQLDSREHEVEVRQSVVCDSPTKASSETEVVKSQPSKSNVDKPPASIGVEEPVTAVSTAGARADDESMESDPTGKEMKHKKSSKKKKSKVVSEPAQGTDLTVQKAVITSILQEDGDKTMANIPSSSVAKPESAQHVETVRKRDAGPAKGTSKDKDAEKTKIVVPDASKDVVKVASKDAGKVASKDVGKVASKDVAHDASKEVVPDPSKVMANDASKGVITGDSKETVPEASKVGLASQPVVFDELGLTDSSTDVGQSLLKKKKKARKDM